MYLDEIHEIFTFFTLLIIFLIISLLLSRPPSGPSFVDKGVVRGVDLPSCSICSKKVPPYGPDDERFNQSTDITDMTTMFVDPVTKRYLKEPVTSVDENESTPQVVHLCNRCLKVAEYNKMVIVPEGAASGKRLL